MKRHPPESRRAPPSGRAPLGRARAAILPAVLIALLLGGCYLRFAWGRYRSTAAAGAITLTQSVAALLPADLIETLAGRPDPGAHPEAALLADGLTRLTTATDTIHYAYIVAERDGGTVVLATSEPVAAPPGSPQAQSCKEATEMDWLSFQTGHSVLTAPVSTQCGTWIRAFAPIKDPETGRIVAALGLSYSAAQWQADLWAHMVPDIIVVLSLLLLVAALLTLWLEHTAFRAQSVRLAFHEALYHNVFEQAPIGILLSGGEGAALQPGFNSLNPMAESILGRSAQDMAGILWPEISPADGPKAELEQFERLRSGQIDRCALERQIIRPDGTSVWLHITASPFADGLGNTAGYLCLLEDISARKAAEGALLESERSKAVLLSHLPGMAYRTRYDREWTVEFASEGCRALTGYAPENLLYNRDLSYNDMISPEYRQLLWDEWTRVLDQRKSFRAEYELVTKTGERKWVLELGQGIYGPDGRVEALEGIVLDISEQKKREARIVYLSEHDFLTGLYSRHHLEQEKKRLDRPEHWPLSLAVFDIDGLRLVNDAYGQLQGDRLIAEAAKLIQSCCREGDVLARVGGDEFMLLMPRTDGKTAHQLAKNIQNTLQSYNRAQARPLYEISLSIGHSTKESEDQSLDEMARTAGEYLKHRKLLNQRSSHHAILSSVMATLYAKSQETEEHGQRLADLTRGLGERLGLEQQTLDDLQLLSMLHDIGKIGVDDRILNKPGPLTADEWEQMERHPEIGYRIAMSTPELEHIAKHILHHQERWDGTGYPLGLRGPEIPLVSRILALADAYDAMTQERVYRRALPQAAAIGEIERCAGTQFDPHLAKLFIEMLAAQNGCPAPPAGTPAAPGV